jgi:hypothetical protein
MTNGWLIIALTMETLSLRLVLLCRACRHDSNTTVRDLPSGRSYRGCTTLDDTVIICGGRSDDNLSDAHVHPLPGQRRTQPHRCTTLFDGTVFICGATSASNWTSDQPTPLPPGTTTRTATSTWCIEPRFLTARSSSAVSTTASNWTSDAHIN